MALQYYSKSQNLTIERGENGKPYFAGENEIFFNGTHSKDLIAVAISDKLIGVDGEYIKKRDFLRIAKEYFSFNEYKLLKSSSKLEIDFYTLWTLKESYIKTFGKKIFDIKDSIEVNLEERAIYNADNLFFATFSLDNCYIIGVCCNIENAEDYNDIVIKASSFNLDLIFAYPEFPQIELIEI
ncbi:4'-phosphopantetheinyl transferase superfamily protein [Brachyspira catarrhinii]|uniref:4'-phosphopantetheinyl transferase superfamily protein n=2 Tax=Brachyspira catarrhinii TaxID=2528966 RepID=A0ABY2TQW9_9SPIR|nr:4'-phosphopantetheinyl transferase superfamily protein [Brachyspira catarrhinii]